MGSEWTEFSVAELIKLGVLEKPMDGNHGEIHPKSKDFVSNGIPFVMASDIKNGRIDTRNCKFITEFQAGKLRKGFSRTGDVLLSHKATIGRTAVVENTGDDYIMLTPQVTYYRVSDHSRLNNKYLRYYFESAPFQNLFNQWAGGGSTRAYLGITGQQKLPIILPPLPEQKAIAHILGSLDDKIELNRKMNATLEAMAQALFKSWFVDFDPVIDNALRAGNPIPEELAERAEIRKKALESNNPSLSAEGTAKAGFPDAFQFTEELGWIPEGWEVVRFDELVSAKQGRYLAKTEMVETADSVFKYPVWGGNGILGFSSSYAYDEPITLMTCRGSNCGLIKFTESSAWISNNSFACPTKYGSQYFLYLYFRNEIFEECVSGSAQPQITYTALKNKIMKFPISEAICELFSNFVQSYKDRQAQNGSQNEALTKLRDTLLPKLISGELRLPNVEAQAHEVPV